MRDLTQQGGFRGAAPPRALANRFHNDDQDGATDGTRKRLRNLKSSHHGGRPGLEPSTAQAAAGPAAHGRRLTGRPTKRLEELLFRRYQRDGDLFARRQLIERFLPLARQLVRRYERHNESLDDLMQVASLGLVKAIDRFEPERGLSFSTYAVPTMLGELRRYFRDSGWALHVPREIQERVLKVTSAVERLSGELGRSPSPKQIADELKLPVEEVLEAIAANAA